METALFPITSFGLRESGYVDGLTPIRLFDAQIRKPRAGVEIRNADPSRTLWVRAVALDEIVESLSAKECDFAVAAGTTLLVAYGHDIDLYIQSAVADGAAAAYVAREVRR